MSWADLTGMAFDSLLAVHGEEVEYRPATMTTPYTIQGAFSEKSYQVDTQTGVPTLTNTPTLEVRRSAVTGGPKQNDKVYLAARAVEYRVTQVEEDGNGNVLLFLHRT